MPALRSTRRVAAAAVVGAVVALGLAGCGGDGDGETAAGTTTVTSDPGVTTTEGTAPSTATTARRARLPGPPGPAGPPSISRAIDVWHPLVEAGVPGGNCRPLLNSVNGPLGAAAVEQPGGRAYRDLYRGIAEGCLDQISAARSALGRARDVGLGPDETSKDSTCNAQLLLVFGFATYLNEAVSPRCPPRTTTTTVRVTTTTTRASTTTTRRPTTTVR